MTNGLDQLNNARASAASRSRRVPPPKHRPTKPTPDANGSPKSEPEQTATATPAAALSEKPGAKPNARDLIRQTVYLDEQTDDLLEAVRSVSRKRRVDANRSAVIRLALRRMSEELTAAQVVEEIVKASRDAGPQGPGRRLI